MSSMAVPQIEYVGGNTPQESVALFNARMYELRFNNPTFERDGMGFWITYNKDMDAHAKGRPVLKGATEHGYPHCIECPHYEYVSDRVKWGACTMHGNASVNRDMNVCEAYWYDEGGDEPNA